MTTACWSRSATPARVSRKRSAAASSSRSTPPSRSARAPASDWTSAGGSSCSATAATSASPRRQATPASRSCCLGEVHPPNSAGAVAPAVSQRMRAGPSFLSASMNGRRLPGRGGEDGSGLLQNLDISAEPAVFAAQLRQLPLLRAGQPTVAAGPGLQLSLAGSRPRRRRNRVNILHHLADLPVFASAPLNGLRLELPGERTAAPGLALHAETARTQRRLGRNIGELTRRTARTGHSGIGVRVMHAPGGRKPALPLRLFQLQRVS